MELRQLEYVVAVAEEASFTRAAERVHVAQPGVSAQVRRLERELGQVLFDRSGRAVALTDAGRAVLPHARAALASVAAIREAVDELAGLLHGQVGVGMVTAGHATELLDLLTAFHADHPGIEIRLEQGRSDELVDAVLDRRLDLAWVGLAGPPPPGLDMHVSADEPIVAAARHGDPLARRQRVTLAALCERPLLSMSAGTGLRSALDDATRAAGLVPNIVMEAATPDVVADLAVEGFGVALLPESVARAYRSRLHAVTITRPRLRSRIGVVWRTAEETSPAARAFVAHARATLASSSVEEAVG